MSIERLPTGSIVITGGHIHVARLLVLTSALKLEVKGIRMTRHSVYAQVKREFGFRGSKARVLAQLEQLVATVLAQGHPGGETQ